MNQIGEGVLVKIPCNVQKGAFPGEYLVTFSADGKDVSGFVRKEDVEMKNSEEGFIEGKVILVEGGHVTLQIRGSFFTGAAGKTSVSSTWADSNLAAAG
jgi:hypothetical protein